MKTCFTIKNLLVIFFPLIIATMICAAPLPVKDAADLVKRGGYFNEAGQWVDDGYWAWSHGDKSTEFVPWANSNTGSEWTPAAVSVGAGAGTGLSSGYFGTGTYYFQGGAAGACGNYNPDDAYIVALQTSMYSSGSHCGKYIMLRNTNTGNSVTALVADMCPGCSSPTSVDLSVGTFKALGGTEEAGTISIEWSFV